MVSLSLTMDQLGFQGLQAKAVQLKINQSKRQLTIQQQIGHFYQGEYQGQAVLNAQKPTLVLTKKGQLTGVQIKPLLQALKKDDRLQGKANINFNTRSQGRDLNALQNNLTGNLKVTIQDGAIQGFNLAEIIRNAKRQWDALRGKPSKSKATNSIPKTDFSSLVATAKLKGPIIDNTSLDLKSPYLRVKGKGQINSKSQQINYQLTTIIVDSAKGQGGKDFRKLTNLPIKMAYKGAMAQMKDWRQWRLNLGDTLKAQLKKEAEDEGRRYLEKKLGVQRKDAKGKKRRTEDMVIDALIKRL
jgi:AsmA protein